MGSYYSRNYFTIDSDGNRKKNSGRACSLRMTRGKQLLVTVMTRKGEHVRGMGEVGIAKFDLFDSLIYKKALANGQTIIDGTEDSISRVRSVL